jgi:type I restriction enzyme S subunit
LEKIVGGGTPSKSNPDYWGGDIPWASVKDIKVDASVLECTEDFITEAGLKNSAANLVPIGTLIISTRMGLGRVVRTKIDTAINQDLKALIPKPELDSDYLLLFLRSKAKELIAKGAGATVSGIKLEQLKSLEIPVPPIEEQKRIVAKIEKQFAKIDEAARLRAESLTLTDQLLPAALHEIFSGPESKGWKEKTLGELAIEIKSGFACGKSNEVSKGVVHLRTHNVDLSGELNLDKIVQIPKDLVDVKAFGLRKGDVIFNNTNSAELVGKSIIIREDLPYAFSNHLTRIRIDVDAVLPEWMLTILQKYWREKIFETMCTRWVGQAGINQTQLKKLKIPLPPPAEQKNIVKKLNALSEKARKLKELQSIQAADLKALKQSILHEAFKV